MSENKASYAKIGFFVLSGMALIFIAIAIAGARVFNQKVILSETYFAESVKGLDIGSSVTYRGVPVGEVKAIGFVYTTYSKKEGFEAGNPHGRSIMVEMALDPQKFSLINQKEADRVLTFMIENGLRAKLTSSGVTGLSYIELDYFERNSQLPPMPAWKPDHFYIPATSSTLASLKKTMDDVMEKVGTLDITALGDELLGTLMLLRDKLESVNLTDMLDQATALLEEVRETNQSLKKLVESPELSAMPGDLAAMTASVRRSAERVEKDIGPFLDRLNSTVTNATVLVANASDVVSDVGGLVSSNRVGITETISALGNSVQALNRTVQTQQTAVQSVLRNLQDTFEQLNQTMKELNANPAALIFGQPPAPLPENERK